MAESTSFDTTNKNLETAITRVRHLLFGAPKVVGCDFAREAFQCLYEHGILGYKIPLAHLGEYLVIGKDSMGVMPAACRLRSINVALECPVCDDMWEETDDQIIDNFTSLLRLDLSTRFELGIHIVVRYNHAMDMHNLLAINKRVEEVIKAFTDKYAKVAVEYHFIYESRGLDEDVPFAIWTISGRLKSRNKRGLGISAPVMGLFGQGLDFEIGGRDAKKLVEAGYYEWMSFLDRRCSDLQLP